MSESIVQVNEEVIKKDLRSLVRETVEETLNALLDEEASALANAARYELKQRGGRLTEAGTTSASCSPRQER